MPTDPDRRPTRTAVTGLGAAEPLECSAVRKCGQSCCGPYTFAPIGPAMIKGAIVAGQPTHFSVGGVSDRRSMYAQLHTRYLVTHRHLLIRTRGSAASPSTANPRQLQVEVVGGLDFTPSSS